MKFIFYTFFIGCFIFIDHSNASQLLDSIPSHETFSIQSKNIGETRTINIWLPEIYNTTTDSLPIMYMLDGGLNEDFPHIANTLDKLIKEKKISPLILVGIENTQRRRDLTGFTEVAEDKKIAPVVGGSKNFRAFIKEELFPEITKRYRTTNKKSVIGESLAGLFIIETLFLDPEMFDNYIAFDPSLWWNNHYLVRTEKEHLSKPLTTEKQLWFAGSKAKDINQFTKKLAAILKTESYTNIKWQYSNEPKEKHVTIFRATKEKAIIWTLNKANN